MPNSLRESLPQAKKPQPLTAAGAEVGVGGLFVCHVSGWGSLTVIKLVVVVTFFGLGGLAPPKKNMM